MIDRQMGAMDGWMDSRQVGGSNVEYRLVDRQVES